MDHAANTLNQERSILPSLREFHIFGNGISFSISPTIHNAGFQQQKLPYLYDIRESPSIDGVEYLIRSSSFGGASVTMPHKLQVHKFCDSQSETAKAIGAINTLIVDSTGGQRKIVGDNTDWSGLHAIIMGYIKRSEQALNAGLVIGAGGASRAALYAMFRAGVQNIYVVNRTSSTAEAVRDGFKDLFPITVVPSLDQLPEKPDLIIGTVPADKTTEAQFANIFGPKGLCIDMAYKPRQTPLLKVAQEHPAWETVAGVQVLLAQAYDQYRLWTGKEPPKETMVAAVAAHEGGARPVDIAPRL